VDAIDGSTDLTWYYNYQVQPSPAYANRTQDEFEFIPMLWTTSDTFLSDIKSLISQQNRNITHVLTYNEPDGTAATGGSNLDPAVAATNWISQVQPLAKMGIQLGAPAVTGSPSGMVWLKAFFAACTAQGTDCTPDFFPAHWYDNFAGLTSHVGELYGTFNKTVWVTEWALANQDLDDSQTFFQDACEFMDRTPWLGRYSYFGAFRSSKSNVGPNAAMLTQNGQLTDIGSWYLGGVATNNIPSATATGGSAKVQMGGVSLSAVIGIVGLMILF